MSRIPSLSLWSSIKIPFYFRPNTDEEIPEDDSDRVPEVRETVPYVCAQKLEKSDGNRTQQTAHEMVNLNVPNSITKEKENLTPSLTCNCPGMNKKRNSILKKDKIRLVTVPEVPFYDENDKGDLGECSPRLPLKNQSEKSLKSSFNYFGDAKTNLLDDPFEGETFCDKLDAAIYSDGEDPDEWIPSVKPWTDKELEEINRRYAEIEARINRIGTSKKKPSRRRGNVLMKERVSEFPLLDLVGNKDSASKKLTHRGSWENEPGFEFNDYWHDCSSIPPGSNLNWNSVGHESGSMERKGKPSDEDHHCLRSTRLYRLELTDKKC